MPNTFTIKEESYTDPGGRRVRVMVMRNAGTGELVEVLLDTPGGQNRSTGAGAVNGLLLKDLESGELREVLPHRRGLVAGLMAPFANRVRNARYHFAGEQHQLARNWDETQTRMTRSGRHAIHGLLPLELAVRAQSCSADSATCTLTTLFDGDDQGYPFNVEVAFTYTLHASQGFSIAVSAINRSRSGQPAPFMVGWHPYVQLKGPLANAIVEFDPRSAFNMALPIGGGPDGPDRDSHPSGSAVACRDFRAGAALGDRYWDDCFKAMASARVVPVLETRVHDSTDRPQATIVLWQDACCRFIQVYTGLREHQVVAIEPMSGQVDCFNNGDGLVVLQAGETWETAFGIRLAAS